MKKFLRKNKSLVDENIASFEKELIDIGSVNPTLIAFGAHTYQILKKSLNNKYRILNKGFSFLLVLLEVIIKSSFFSA